MLFGTGLVKTVDDFGAEGEPPSHPELLDWLATEFIRSGWDVKSLLRLMVTSATYRQSSRVNAERARSRPREPPAGAWASAAAAGRDDPRPGASARRAPGRPNRRTVRETVPAPGLWNELADAEYVQDHGPNLYRRSLYTYWKRTVPPPADGRVRRART